MRNVVECSPQEKETGLLNRDRHSKVNGWKPLNDAETVTHFFEYGYDLYVQYTVSEDCRTLSYEQLCGACLSPLSNHADWTAVGHAPDARVMNDYVLQFSKANKPTLPWRGDGDSIVRQLSFGTETPSPSGRQDTLRLIYAESGQKKRENYENLIAGVALHGATLSQRKRHPTTDWRFNYYNLATLKGTNVTLDLIQNGVGYGFNLLSQCCGYQITLSTPVCGACRKETYPFKHVNVYTEPNTPERLHAYGLQMLTEAVEDDLQVNYPNDETTRQRYAEDYSQYALVLALNELEQFFLAR